MATTFHYKTVDELLIDLSTQIRDELNENASAETIRAEIKRRLSVVPKPVHFPERSEMAQNLSSGISYDLVKTPGNDNRFYLKPRLRASFHFSEICRQISDKCSATESDVIHVSDALYKTAISQLAYGAKFILYRFGVFRITLTADQIPDSYMENPKGITIKSIEFEPSLEFVKSVRNALPSMTTSFTRERLYCNEVLSKQLRYENILHALTQKPFLSAGEIASLNNVSLSAAYRDIKYLIATQRIYTLTDGISKKYRLNS